MPRLLSDDEIQRLLDEPKVLPRNWKGRLEPLPKQNVSFGQRSLRIPGEVGDEFRIIVRLSNKNLFNFSIILSFKDANGDEHRLLRYNGKHSSEHTNKWEKREGGENVKFRNSFHVHRATERYQLAGFKIDGYAEVTTEYGSFESALQTFVNGNGFRTQSDDLPGQMRLEL